MMNVLQIPASAINCVQTRLEATIVPVILGISYRMQHIVVIWMNALQTNMTAIVLLLVLILLASSTAAVTMASPAMALTAKVRYLAFY